MGVLLLRGGVQRERLCWKDRVVGWPQMCAATPYGAVCEDPRDSHVRPRADGNYILYIYIIYNFGGGPSAILLAMLSTAHPHPHGD